MADSVELGGMTDLQYKGMLLDQKSDWEHILYVLKTASNAEVVSAIEKQIEKINKKLMF